MELLLALDSVTRYEAIDLVRELRDWIDAVEVGTPLIIREGVRPVSDLKTAFPALRVMADLKIMDAGEYETTLALEAGADIVTVLALSDDATIQAAVRAARRFHKNIMVDMIGVQSLETRAAEIDALGVDYLCVHTAFDLQGSASGPLEGLRRVAPVVRRARVAVAGGIGLNTIDEIVRENPAVVIVGGGIIGEADRRDAAQQLRRRIESSGG